MPGYLEMRDDWHFLESEAGLEGTRVFIEKAGGPDDLPDLGDLFDTDPVHQYCGLRTIEAVLYGVESGVNKKKYILSYSSKAIGGDPTFIFDSEQRNFQGGAEAISVPPHTNSSGTPNWKWSIGGGNIKDIDIFKIIPAGTFTRSIKLNGDAAKNTWFTSKFLPAVGKINDDVFENFREGSVYFSGCSGGAQYDKYGHRTWILECQFAWKLIQSAGVVRDDWLYLLRPNDCTWDKPIDLAGKYLYEKCPLLPVLQ